MLIKLSEFYKQTKKLEIDFKDKIISSFLK
jgi:hypothetical protein